MELASIDKLLTTTRSVRKRLDFERLVEPKIILECLNIALQIWLQLTWFVFVIRIFNDV